jgi:hypothetical protein
MLRLLFIYFLLLGLLTNQVIAQDTEKNNDPAYKLKRTSLKKPEHKLHSPILEKFELIYLDSTLYINIVSKDLKQDGFFVIEKKSGELYASIAFKEVIGSSLDGLNLLYSATCKHISNPAGLYRLTLWDKTGIYQSKEITLTEKSINIRHLDLQNIRQSSLSQ